MDAGRQGLLLLLAALGVFLLGVRQLAAASRQEEALADRSAAASEELRLRALRRSLDARLRRTARGRRLLHRLRGAGVALWPLDFLLISAGAALAGFAIAGSLAGPWTGALAGGGCVLGVWAWVERRRRKRNREFVGQLPEVARLLANGSAAGLSLTGALDRAVEDIGEPAKSELGLVRGEIRLGQSVERALERLSERLPSRELHVLAVALVIQQRTGGNLAQALRDLARTLEARKDLAREVRTLMAGARFSARAVVVMGAGGFLLLNAILPGRPLDKMASSPLGLAALATAAMLYALGFVLIRRVGRIET